MAKRTRQILRRIRNVRHVRQITHAMYIISASQVTLRKRALASARPFEERVDRAIAPLLSAAGERGVHHPLFEPGAGGATGILVVSSDRGLCGRFVAEVNQAAASLIRERGEVRVIAVGEKAVAFLRRKGLPLDKAYIRAYERPDLGVAERIVGDLLALFPGEVREFVAVYMRFLGELRQRVTVEPLLPLRIEPAPVGPLITEPDVRSVLEVAGRVCLLGKVHRMLVEAKTAEHAMRRQAMKAATDNADELLEKLTLMYNKARQQGITREIMDIMGGAEALREEG